MFTATFDTRELERGVRRLVGDQMPFAVALTLTKTAKDAQSDERHAAAGSMTLRNNWVQRGFQVTAARKSDGIDRMQAVVGHRDWYIEQQMGEPSVTRTPRSKRHLYVPLRGVRKSKGQRIRRNNRPGALLKKKNIFFIESKGKTFIARVGRGDRITLMYMQLRRQRIDPVASFKNVFLQSVAQKIGNNFLESASTALKTRR